MYSDVLWKCIWRMFTTIHNQRKRKYIFCFMDLRCTNWSFVQCYAIGMDGRYCNVKTWVKEGFFKHERSKPKPIILFFDGHASHLRYDMVLAAQSKRVHIICLPPHTSNAFQPLNVGVCAPAKKEWSKILKQYYLKSRKKTFSRKHLVFY